jgi:hypothetical protein
MTAGGTTETRHTRRQFFEVGPPAVIFAQISGARIAGFIDADQLGAR